MVVYLDLSIEFHLTTDGSNYAIGAVLSQDDMPITFLSMSLNKTKEACTTNEKEMLAIIWVLTSLRNFLYSSKNVRIFTDHQPLTYALSNRNSNIKMKRWKAIVEEFNHELKYKAGKTNVLADGLPADGFRPYTVMIAHPTTSYHQFNFLSMSLGSDQNLAINFPNFYRHIITDNRYPKENIIRVFKRFLNPHIAN